jgi:hypothetical protein
MYVTVRGIFHTCVGVYQSCHITGLVRILNVKTKVDLCDGCCDLSVILCDRV